jgi:precorrin-2 dehydrogenase/sirohydrochlorin ferrochelatase
VPAEKAYYMACLDLEGRRCLVVGGGSIGIEKASGLLDCGASVTVVAPQADAGLLELPLEWLRRAYRPSDLDGRYVVVAATSNRSVNRRVFADAEARALLCNVVDTPELCSFILPAVHREGPIAVAVSTGGASPALAQHLRERLAEQIRPEHADLAERLRTLRPWAKAHYPTYEQRRDYFQRLVEEALA